MAPVVAAPVVVLHEPAALGAPCVVLLPVVPSVGLLLAAPFVGPLLVVLLVGPLGVRFLAGAELQPHSQLNSATRRRASRSRPLHRRELNPDGSEWAVSHVPTRYVVARKHAANHPIWNHL